MKSFVIAAGCSLLSGNAGAKELHVSKAGNDAYDGSAAKPLLTINAAAAKAQPGDTVTVHSGVYREHVNPPRGGTSDNFRIIYRAAPGEKVTLTGSEAARGWEKAGHDTWRLTFPNSYFGKFNPFAERVYGDWFDPRGRVHQRGCVYLNGGWLAEAPGLGAVMQPAGQTPLWFAVVDGVAAEEGYLMNVVWLRPAGGGKVPASKPAARGGTQNAPGTEDGECVGYIRNGNWLRYDNVDFGKGAETVEIRAAAALGTGGTIELRLDKADGELIGTCAVTDTGDWQKWQSFTAKIKKTVGRKNLCLVFRPTKPVNAEPGSDNTVIYAQFPGVNPNEAQVEISVRPTVFTPEKINIDYITVRGFDLRNAASNWAAPTAGQVGLVTAYWCKGWVIEDNEISYSRCCGIALGKYSDQWDGQRGSTEGYYLTIDDALKKDGWAREKIGGHLVRNNHIHHCGQTGIVGSLGCAFSKVIGNEIHDINLQGIWGGAEMAGIKFHGALDVVIAGNHIYRCGGLAGIWLDWMAQGTRVSGNLLHDNRDEDLFVEVNHGPFLVDNNLFLSTESILTCSQGGAFVHNLLCGSIRNWGDGRQTPFHKPHSTELAGMHPNPTGGDRYYNNVLAQRMDLGLYNSPQLPVWMEGNVFLKGAKPSSQEKEPLLKPEVDAGVRLTQKAAGWHLEINADTHWAAEQKRRLVTTERLGKASIPNAPFENPDGTPLKLDTDYLGKKRNADNPFPGPFEAVKDGKQVIKVWPK
ncbi:MAG: carbohydrate-binding protein [bacterium]